MPDQVASFLELAGSAYSLYKSSFLPDKQDWVKTVISNRKVEGKKLEFTLALPFNELAKRHEFTYGSPYRYTFRTLERIIKKLVIYFKQNPAPELNGDLEPADEL